MSLPDRDSWVDGYRMGVAHVAPPAPPRSEVEDIYERFYVTGFHDDEPTEDEIREYRLDAEDPYNRSLNWMEWAHHKAIDRE